MRANPTEFPGENDLIFVVLTQVPQIQTEPFHAGLLKAIGDVFQASDHN